MCQRKELHLRKRVGGSRVDGINVCSMRPLEEQIHSEMQRKIKIDERSGSIGSVAYTLRKM